MVVFAICPHVLVSCLIAEQCHLYVRGTGVRRVDAITRGKSVFCSFSFMCGFPLPSPTGCQAEIVGTACESHNEAPHPEGKARAERHCSTGRSSQRRGHRQLFPSRIRAELHLVAGFLFWSRYVASSSMVVMSLPSALMITSPPALTVVLSAAATPT